jgi:peptidoglycan/xylan/chitin deacetylase (PgdA/CDA1 family)
LKHGKAPRKSILLTFDDGYLDDWVYVHSVLERHGLKATMFLVTEWPQDLPKRPPCGPKRATRLFAAHANPQGM